MGSIGLRGLWVVGVVVSLSWSGSVGAQTDQERAGARSAAKQGVSAFDEGRHREALEYMEKAESLLHAPIHLLYIARSHAALNELVAAREAYMKLVNEVLPQGASKVFIAAQEAAQAELPQMEERIPYLTIRLGGAGAKGDAKVVVDGKELPSALLGVPVPIDPGAYKVQVSSSGQAGVAKEVVLAEGARETVELELLPHTPSVEANDGPVASTSPQDRDEPSGSARSTWGYALTGGGGALLGVGATFGLLALNQRDDAREDPALCPNSECSPSGRSEIDSARTKARIATLASGLGLVAVGTGVYLLLTDQEQAPATQTGFSSELGPSGGYVSYRGAF